MNFDIVYPPQTEVDKRVSRYVDRTANPRRALKMRAEQFPVAYAFFSDANIAYLAAAVRPYVARVDIPSLEVAMGRFYLLLGDKQQVAAGDKDRIRQLVANMNKAVVQDYLFRTQVKAVRQTDYAQFRAQPYGPAGVAAIRPINDNRFDRTRVTTSVGGTRRLW